MSKPKAADRPTAGEWRYIREDLWNGNPRIVTNLPGMTCNILIANVGGQREAHHNGALMAASKQLLTACRMLARATTPDAVERARRAAVAAIEKAKAAS